MNLYYNNYYVLQKDIRFVCDGSVVDIPHSVALKEFELLAKNTDFNLVTYKVWLLYFTYSGFVL